MTYEEAKAHAQYFANREGTEYGIASSPIVTPKEDSWGYAEASWWVTVHKKMGLTLDDIELILPTEPDEEMDTWQKIFEHWDNYDPTPNE